MPERARIAELEGTHCPRRICAWVALFLNGGSQRGRVFIPPPTCAMGVSRPHWQPASGRRARSEQQGAVVRRSHAPRRGALKRRRRPAAAAAAAAWQRPAATLKSGASARCACSTQLQQRQFRPPQKKSATALCGDERKFRGQVCYLQIEI